MFCWKKKKGKIAAKLKSIWDGFWRWGSDFQKHRPSFPNRPSWPWSCPDCCEWNLADTDWPHFMCLLPSHLFCFLFFFFLYYSLITFSRKHFLSFILHTANPHLHTRTHIHTHGSATTIHYLLVLNLQRPQSALPVPGVQMALFGTESGIGTSRALLPLSPSPWALFLKYILVLQWEA